MKFFRRNKKRKEEKEKQEEQEQPKAPATNSKSYEWYRWCTQKLDLALWIAESIVDLNGYEDGLMIHDDLQVFQWLFGPSSTLKIE